MRKAILSILLLILALIFTSCSNGGTETGLSGDNDEKIADETFNKMITAVRLEDDSQLADMFSNTIKNEDDLSQSASMFIDFIQGDIVSHSSASEAGVGVDYKTESGKNRKEIQSAFYITTTESTYYIAIKECIKDEVDNNIGLLSIYIIEANNWTEDYVYRGDGKWIPGINIVDALA